MLQSSLTWTNWKSIINSVLFCFLKHTCSKGKVLFHICIHIGMISKY